MTSSTRGSSSSSSCTPRRWASLAKIVSIVDIQRCGRVRRVVDAADRDHVLKLVVTYKVVCITSIIAGTIMKSHVLDKNDADHHQAYLLLGVSLDSILAERSSLLHEDDGRLLRLQQQRRHRTRRCRPRQRLLVPPRPHSRRPRVPRPGALLSLDFHCSCCCTCRCPCSPSGPTRCPRRAHACTCISCACACACTCT